MKKILFLILLTLCVQHTCFVQSAQAQSKGDWPHIPGFDPSLPTTLTDRTTLVGVIGLAALSYTLEEFILKNHENINYYSARAGMNNEYAWGLKNVWNQNLGIEHRIAPWFSVSAELTLQEWHDRTPHLNTRFGVGLGLMTYYRWYIFGKKRLSPYIEYGTGVFYGLSKFPYNGTHMSFSNSSQLGLEYTIRPDFKVRMSYGNVCQTNYNLLDSNPGYDGNGLNLGVSWRM